MCVTPRITLVLEFPYWDSRVFQAMSDRDLRSRALTVSFSDGLSMSVGSPLYRPNNSNPSGPLPQARQAYILSSSSLFEYFIAQSWDTIGSMINHHGYTACVCACALLSCEVKWVLWMAWKEGMWVWLAGDFFLFCLLGFSLFFYLFYLICGG